MLSTGRWLKWQSNPHQLPLMVSKLISHLTRKTINSVMRATGICATHTMPLQCSQKYSVGSPTATRQCNYNDCASLNAKPYVHTDAHLEKPYQTGIFLLQHLIATKNHPTPKDSPLYQLPMIFPTLNKKHSRDHHLVQNHPSYLI